MELLTMEQVCKTLDISMSTLNRWITDNKVIKIPEGGKNHFDKFES